MVTVLAAIDSGRIYAGIGCAEYMIPVLFGVVGGENFPE